MEKTIRKGIRILAIPLVLAASASAAHASVISFTGSGGSVDATSRTRSIVVDITDLGSLMDTIYDVNLAVEFSKCGERQGRIGCRRRFDYSGNTSNSEIEFSLRKGRTVVDLVTANTFTGQDTNVSVTQVYDDEASARVGGSLIESGAFRPVQSLSAFDGQSALGRWRFSFGDTVYFDPLIVHSWTLTLDLRESVAQVPEPSSLALLSIGVMGFGAAARRNRLAKAQRADNITS